MQAINAGVYILLYYIEDHVFSIPPFGDHIFFPLHIFARVYKSGLPEPVGAEVFGLSRSWSEPGFLAEAGAEIFTWLRLLILLYSTLNILFLRDLSMAISMTMTMSYDDYDYEDYDDYDYYDYYEYKD